MQMTSFKKYNQFYFQEKSHKNTETLLRLVHTRLQAHVCFYQTFDIPVIRVITPWCRGPPASAHILTMLNIQLNKGTTRSCYLGLVRRLE